MAFIACKLPHGLRIDHNGRTLVLAGANIGEQLNMPSPNGMPADNSNRMFGYGLTEVSSEQAALFEDWSAHVTHVDGDKTKPKLTQPFGALENGAILGPFNTRTEAQKECGAMADIVTTGFEGKDPESMGQSLGITTDSDAAVKPKK